MSEASPVNVNISIPWQQIYDVVTDAYQKVSTLAIEIFGQIKDVVHTADIDRVIVLAKGCLTEVERIFNICACIPVVCFLSSKVRLVFGYALVASGFALGGVGEIGKIVTPQTDPLHKKFVSLANSGKECLIHGALNLIRGTIEQYIASTTMGLGNVILIVPNALLYSFGPAVPYNALKV